MRKNYKSFKKFISLMLTAAFILAAVSISAENTALLSDSGYASLDLSLTKTVYSTIGETGVVKAAVIKEKAVSMYAIPYYSNTSSSSSEKYYAVKVDSSSTKDNYTYLRKSSATKTTFSARPQRVMLESTNLTYSSDNTQVATVDANGVITITGYGVANISATYNGGTPSVETDDVKGAITILATEPNGNIASVDNTLQWTDSNHTDLEMRINKVATSSVPSILEPSNLRFAQTSLTSAFDPIGDDSSPLTMHVTGSNNLLVNQTYVSDETVASGDASLIKAEYAAGNFLVMQGWYYESGNAKAETVYPKIGFGYCGTTDISSFIGDGRRAWLLGNKVGGNYRIWGGDANTYAATTYIAKDKIPSTSPATTTASAKAINNPSGIDTVIPATKGWHQFVLTVEPSMVNPGTDYLLTKVYLDGTLITAQDIYVGDIDIAKREFFIFLPKLAESVGYTSDSAGSGKDYIHYKDLRIAKFDRSQTIIDSIPANNSQNVPLYQTIKVKLGAPVESLASASVTLNGKAVNTELDDSKTIITVKAGKLSANTTYTLSMLGENIVFKTTSDERLTTMLDDMETYGYSVTDARSLDFANPGKSAEEYGIGFMRHGKAQSVTVSDGIATFEEGKRTSLSGSGRNAVILRNLTEFDSKADRIVVSYKVKLNVPSSYTEETAYELPQTTDFTGGMGVPIIAKKDLERPYNPIVRSYLPGATGKDLTGGSSVSSFETTNGKISHKSLLEGNTGKSDSHAYALDGTKVEMARLSQTSFTFWRQIVYVVDVDTTGNSAPTWYFVDVNSSAKGLNSENAIYKLEVPAAYGAGYTWVDSLYIPVSRSSVGVTVPVSFSVKDVEIYSLSLDSKANIENEVEVVDSETSQIVYADELSGKTVDISIKGHIDANSMVVFSAYDAVSGNMRLENVTTVRTAQESSSVTVKNFLLPQSENIQICVFVWDAFNNKKSYETKYVYNSVR